MVWYTPLTILPAVGLLILSTSNFLVALNVEIYELEKDKELHKWIIGEKIKQLKRLGIANSFLYSSALIFMFSTFSMSIFNQKMLFHCMMITALNFSKLFIKIR